MSEFTDSFHRLTASTISQLVAFLQLRSNASNDQAASQAPFATHPVTLYVAVSSFVVNYLIHVALLRCPTSRRFADMGQHFLVWSAYVAVSTLAAAVFPATAAPFLYVIFGLLSAGEVFYMFEDNLLIESEIEEGEETSKLEVYRRRFGRFLKHIRSEKMAKFFGKQSQPMILPIWSPENWC